MIILNFDHTLIKVDQSLSPIKKKNYDILDRGEMERVSQGDTNCHLAHRCIVQESDFETADFLGSHCTQRRDDVIGRRFIPLNLYLLFPVVQYNARSANFHYALKSKIDA